MAKARRPPASINVSLGPWIPSFIECHFGTKQCRKHSPFIFRRYAVVEALGIFEHQPWSGLAWNMACGEWRNVGVLNDSQTRRFELKGHCQNGRQDDRPFRYRADSARVRRNTFNRQTGADRWLCFGSPHKPIQDRRMRLQALSFRVVSRPEQMPYRDH